MPYYEYRCKKCNQVFEVFQKITEEPKKKHEKCGGALEKLISNTAFQLKGSGWYKTDYAPAKASQSKKPEKPKETKSPKKDS